MYVEMQSQSQTTMSSNEKDGLGNNAGVILMVLTRQSLEYTQITLNIGLSCLDMVMTKSNLLAMTYGI